MIDPKIKELLYELPKTSHGQALKAHLDSAYEALTDVDNCKDWEDAAARKHARAILRRIFEFYGDKPIVDKPKRMYT